MDKSKWYRLFLALICPTSMVLLTVGNAKASPTLQSKRDFATIDAYVAEQVNNLLKSCIF
jgi:hypothetical protein